MRPSNWAYGNDGGVDSVRLGGQQHPQRYRRLMSFGQYPHVEVSYFKWCESAVNRQAGVNLPGCHEYESPEAR